MSGSPRRKGNSDILLSKVLKGVAQAGVQEHSINLSTLNFKGCIGCEKCRKDKVCTGITDEMTPLYDEIIQAKGLVAVCPTHNYNVTSWMKAFIDRLYCFYNFENNRPRSWSSQLSGQGRVAVVVAICEQEDPEDKGFTIEAMTGPLNALGYEVVGELAVFKIFDKGKVRDDKESLAEAFRLGEMLAKEISQGSPRFNRGVNGCHPPAEGGPVRAMRSEFPPAPESPEPVVCRERIILSFNNIF